VYYELDATDPAKPYTPGPGTFYTALIETAGGINIGASLSGEWAQIGLEALLSMDPDLILLGDAQWGVTPESIAQRPGWNTLTAVKNNRVLPFDDNLIARIGPRQVDGLEALARVLHPEAFK
jgi:iron complex transport system substrate-binding protein